MLLGELRLLVSNVRRVEQVAPEDGTMQLAIKTNIDDYFTFLTAQGFAGRTLRSVPFDNVDDLLNALDDLLLNQTVACTSSRQNGGGALMMTRSRTYAKALHSQKFGGGDGGRERWARVRR